MGLLDAIKGIFGGGDKPKSPEELALLNAIAANREDMSRRLAYAAYLEAQQNPLGTYIRCEVERQKLPDGDARGVDLTNQADDLMQKHGKRWVRPFKALELEPLLIGIYQPSLWFNRGMVEELTIDKRGAVPGKLTQIVELAPALRKLVFARCTPDWNGVAAAPLMSRIEALDLADVKPKLEDLRALAQSPHLANLQELDLGDKEFGAQLAQVIAASPHWKSLKLLRLSSCKLGEKGAIVLAGSANLANLEELDLAYNDIGPEGLRALVQSPHLKNLKRLGLDSNELSAEAADLLAGATFRHLEELNLGSNNLGPEAVVRLAQAPIFSKLRVLKMNYVEADDHALAAWLASPQMGSIETFEWSGNNMSNAGLQRLASSPNVRNIQILELCSNNFSTVAPITRSAQLKNLEQLKLYSVTLDSADLDALRAARPEIEVQI